MRWWLPSTADPTTVPPRVDEHHDGEISPGPPFPRLPAAAELHLSPPFSSTSSPSQRGRDPAPSPATPPLPASTRRCCSHSTVVRFGRQCGAAGCPVHRRACLQSYGTMLVVGYAVRWHRQVQFGARSTGSAARLRRHSSLHFYCSFPWSCSSDSDLPPCNPLARPCSATHMRVQSAARGWKLARSRACGRVQFACTAVQFATEVLF